MKSPQLVLRIAIFLSGLVFLDFGIGFVGDHLALSPYALNTTLTKLSSAKNVDILAVGGCRAALHIDPHILGSKLGVNAFNAGKAAEGLGNVEVALNVGLSSQSPKFVLIVIDDGNMEESFADIQSEVERRMPWLPFLNSSSRNYLIERYKLDNPINYSGLWRYHGQGEMLLVSAVRLLRKKTILASDGYEPRQATQNILPSLAEGSKTASAIKQGIKKTLMPSSFALETISGMIESVKKAGSAPVLVVVPMHYYRATDEVNVRQEAVMRKLAEKHAIPLLFYLDNNSAIAHKNEWWSDQGHMNRLGAEAFSEVLATDMMKLYPKIFANSRMAELK